MAPKDPHRWAFIPLCDPFSWVSTGHSDLLLMNTIWLKWWHISSMIRLQRDCHFPLAYPLLLALLWEGSSHILNCLVEKSMQQRAQEPLPHCPANSQGFLRLSVKRPVNDPGSTPAPGEFFRWDHRPSWHLDPLWETLRQRHTAIFHLDSWPMESLRRGMCVVLSCQVLE